MLLITLLLASAAGGGQPGPADGGATASVTDGGTVVVGSLDKELIREVVLAGQSRISACDESALTEARAEGKVSVRFEISPSGAVGAAEVRADTTQRSSLAACVASEVLRLKFPKPKGGGKVVVTYPFFFGARPDAGTSLSGP
jgi:hypothetical protein